MSWSEDRGLAHHGLGPGWKGRSLALAVAVVSSLVSWLGLGAGWACGPNFPNLFLAGGDNALLLAPVAGFRAELMRLDSGHPLFPTRFPTNGSYLQQTIVMELADLEVALRTEQVEPERKDRLLAGYKTARQALLAHAQAAGLDSYPWQRPAQPPQFIAPEIPPGLPAEFDDYLRGAVAWHGANTNQARQAWQRLLSRPPGQRVFRSTWAAFMLGRLLAEQDPAGAIGFYQQTRALAKAGFVDSLGLAASTVGWEAQAEYHLGHYERAIQLYLEQLGSGDETAFESLRWVASDAVRLRVRSLTGLARQPQARQVITAYIISGGFNSSPVDVDGPVRDAAANLLTKAAMVPAPTGGWHAMERPAVRWLEALETVGAQDVEAAERFALAAYQCGQFDLAQRWVSRCSAQPVARWLQAKLWLRDGRVRDAAQQLAGLVRDFPPNPPAAPASTGLLGEVSIEAYQHTASHQLLGELGALRLARRDYAEALEALMRGGFWPDAAYVAERVLTLEELKTFVDQRGTLGTDPEPVATGAGETASASAEGFISAPSATVDNLRYLLGRRLTRAGRGREATAYYPRELRRVHRQYVDHVEQAADPGRPKAEQATVLWAAAQLAREQGMALLGTELEPDWAIHGGSYEDGNTVRARAAVSAFARASWEELSRGRVHRPEPEERYHYRYVAAALAWKAAQLMPDNSDETARVLCVAGTWLKHRDPAAADVFYKALVRRCRRTALGQAADHKRWFPAVP